MEMSLSKNMRFVGGWYLIGCLCYELDVVLQEFEVLGVALVEVEELWWESSREGTK